MADTKKVRMIISRGNPTSGVIIRAGAVIELPEFWAKKFIDEGAAEPLVTQAKAETKKPTKTKKK